MSTCQVALNQKREMSHPRYSSHEEPQKVYVGPSGGTRIKCPHCETARHIKVSDKFLHKVVGINCFCQHRFPVIFEKRSSYRKEVVLLGIYWNSSNEKHYMTVTSLSNTGIGFETARKSQFKVGDVIRVRFMLDNSRRSRIDEMVEIKRVEGRKVGAQFSRLGEYEKKAIGFYLM
jgi:hypothetical protein